MLSRDSRRWVLLAALAALALPAGAGAQAHAVSHRASTDAVMYRTAKVDGMDIFYREAGPRTAPTLLLLHGFPTSSQMYRNLIPALMDRYHVVAPDFPGYGQSSMPPRDQFQYTFANLADVTEKFTRAIGLDRYTLYVMDYGAPVGYRMAIRNPERVQALIVQNGNAYEEGLTGFWAPFRRYWNEPTQANRDSMRALLKLDATKWQYLNGVRDSARISPDAWTVDQRLLDRPGNDEVQLDLFYDYRTNVPMYPQFQAYFRRWQPPTLIIWGKNDLIFPAEGAEPYRRDLRTVEYHLLDTGHFALEDKGGEMAELIRGFMARHVPSRDMAPRPVAAR